MYRNGARPAVVEERLKLEGSVSAIRAARRFEVARLKPGPQRWDRWSARHRFARPDASTLRDARTVA